MYSDITGFDYPFTDKNSLLYLERQFACGAVNYKSAIPACGSRNYTSPELITVTIFTFFK